MIHSVDWSFACECRCPSYRQPYALDVLACVISPFYLKSSLSKLDRFSEPCYSTHIDLHLPTVDRSSCIFSNNTEPRHSIYNSESVHTTRRKSSSATHRRHTQMCISNKSELETEDEPKRRKRQPTYHGNRTTARFGTSVSTSRRASPS